MSIFVLVTCPSTWPELQGGESGGDGVDVAAQSVDQGVQGGQIVGEDALHPGRQLIALQVAHHGGEVADMVGDGVELGAAGPDVLEIGGIIRLSGFRDRS
ncbi:hypothetical protein [Streptomyces sp. NPDC004376]